MGLYRKDYIVFGWKLSYNIIDSNGEEVDIDDDKFLPMIEGHENEEYTLICGEGFNVFGLLVLCGGDEYEGWGFEKLKLENYDSEKVKNKYTELFNNNILEEPTLFIFSNFS